MRKTSRPKTPRKDTRIILEHRSRHKSEYLQKHDVKMWTRLCENEGKTTGLIS